MSNQEPNEVYVYQPYGALSNPELGGEIYGVAGPVRLGIKGVTKKTAEELAIIFNHPEFVVVMLEILNKLRFETMAGKRVRQSTRNEIHKFYEKYLEE
jgi:hypothetical protein